MMSLPSKIAIFLPFFLHSKVFFFKIDVRFSPKRLIEGARKYLLS